MQNANYVKLLLDTLRKKNAILDSIKLKNAAQEILLSKNPYDDAAIEKNFQEKGALVDQLAPLDDGFESIFHRAEADIEANKEAYKPYIEEMQELIKQITEKGLQIQSQEAKNRTLAEAYFSAQRKGVRQARSQVKAVSAYRDAMNRYGGNS